MAKSKYFHIKDEETGKDYMVEEVEAETIDEEEGAPSEEEMHDDDMLGLSEEEIASLKALAAKSKELLALLEVGAQDSDEEEEEMHDEDEDEEDEVHDEDENGEEEGVVDTEEDEPNKAKDSFGATIKTKKTKDSGLEDHEMEINEAWRKRYSEV